MFGKYPKEAVCHQGMYIRICLGTLGKEESQV